MSALTEAERTEVEGFIDGAVNRGFCMLPCGPEGEKGRAAMFAMGRALQRSGVVCVWPPGRGRAPLRLAAVNAWLGLWRRRSAEIAWYGLSQAWQAR